MSSLHAKALNLVSHNQTCLALCQNFALALQSFAAHAPLQTFHSNPNLSAHETILSSIQFVASLQFLLFKQQVALEKELSRSQTPCMIEIKLFDLITTDFCVKEPPHKQEQE